MGEGPRTGKGNGIAWMRLLRDYCPFIKTEGKMQTLRRTTSPVQKLTRRENASGVLPSVNGVCHFAFRLDIGTVIPQFRIHVQFQDIGK